MRISSSLCVPRVVLQGPQPQSIQEGLKVTKPSFALPGKNVMYVEGGH